MDRDAAISLGRAKAAAVPGPFRPAAPIMVVEMQNGMVGSGESSLLRLSIEETFFLPGGRLRVNTRGRVYTVQSRRRLDQGKEVQILVTCKYSFQFARRQMSSLCTHTNPDAGQQTASL